MEMTGNYKLVNMDFLRRLILSVVACTAILTTFMCSLFMHAYSVDLTVYFESQINQLKVAHQQETKKLTDSYENELIEMESKVMLLSENNQLLRDQFNDLRKSEEVTFSTLQKYWYVFKDAPKDSGLTLSDIVHLDKVCKEQDVNPDVMCAIFNVESDYRIKCRSTLSTATGLGQVLKGTGKYIYNTLLSNTDPYDHSMALNAKTNMTMSVRYVRYLLDKCNQNTTKAIQYYNGGKNKEAYARWVFKESANVGCPIITSHYQ